MSFDMTNWSSMQVNPMEAMAANFGAFMTKVHHLSQRRRRPPDIELLSTTTDTERWFPAYARSQGKVTRSVAPKLAFVFHTASKHDME
jgi:hypothetical protein